VATSWAGVSKLAQPSCWRGSAGGIQMAAVNAYPGRLLNQTAALLAAVDFLLLADRSLTSLAAWWSLSAPIAGRAAA